MRLRVFASRFGSSSLYAIFEIVKGLGQETDLPSDSAYSAGLDVQFAVDARLSSGVGVTLVLRVGVDDRDPDSDLR